MESSYNNQGDKTKWNTVIACVLLAGLMVALFLFQSKNSRRLASRRQGEVRSTQAWVDANAAFARLARLNLYFASLGEITKDPVTDKMEVGTGGPTHPRVLRIHPSLKEMVASLGVPAHQERDTAVWNWGSGGNDMKISARFRDGKLVAALLETREFREHLGVKSAEWQWHKLQ